MVTTLQMVKVDGNPAPSVVQVDCDNIYPNASGVINVSAEHVHDLMRAGWGIQVTSGTTHVP